MEQIDRDLWPIIYSYCEVDEIHMFSTLWSARGFNIDYGKSLIAGSRSGSMLIINNQTDNLEHVKNILIFEHRHLFQYISGSHDYQFLIELCIHYDKSWSLEWVYQQMEEYPSTTSHATLAVHMKSLACFREICDWDSRVIWERVIDIIVATNQHHMLDILIAAAYKYPASYNVDRLLAYIPKNSAR